jgi:O-succinylbenzoate synthase
MAIYQFSYTPYRRRFKQPLRTSHGIWEIREGIIVNLTDDRGVSHQGEIAPIPWFGSESIGEAIACCAELGKTITPDRIQRIPDTLPACQFGLGAALMAFTQSHIIDESSLSWCALLPTGAAALAAWGELWAQGYSTFKWKIGVERIEQELSIWEKLIADLPPTAKLRLDANGGLNYQTAAEWLKVCEHRSSIELIEQPLAPQHWDEIYQLAQNFSTPIALDESVATFSQLQEVYHRGWRGIYTIKPGIAGFPWRLREFIDRHQLDVVLSSVLETAIGRSSVLNLFAPLGGSGRAIGFGVDSWFEP